MRYHHFNDCSLAESINARTNAPAGGCTAPESSMDPISVAIAKARAAHVGSGLSIQNTASVPPSKWPICMLAALSPKCSRAVDTTLYRNGKPFKQLAALRPNTRGCARPSTAASFSTLRTRNGSPRRIPGSDETQNTHGL